MNEPTKQNTFALLLIGDPKSRKTSLAFQFPKPIVIDCDNNLDGVIRFYPGREHKRIVIDYDENGNEVALHRRWPRLVEAVNQNWNLPGYDTIIIDSMTKIRQYLCDFIVNESSATKDLLVGGQKMMQMQHWGAYAVLLQRFVAGLRRIPKYVIMTAHVHREKDEATSRWLFTPAIGGQSETTLAGLFTDVWYTSYEMSSPTKECPDGIKYIVRTVPTPQMTLGNSLGLPANFEFTWEEFNKRMEKFK